MRLPILALHICAGLVALLSGAAALSFRKGSHRHRMAGNVFFISMLTLSTAAVYLAFMKHQMNNVFGGVLTFYLVATAWVTARRRNGGTNLFDWGALLVAFAVGVVIVTYGFEAAKTPIRGVPAGMFFFLVSWLYFPLWGTFGCSCAVAFSVDSESCVICGACALGCLSPRDLFS
jgi:uncharacterized membrane protein